jgi:hypothetical protein
VSRRPKGKLAPFVPIFRHTMKSPAWRALSVGARATFLQLKSNYNTNAQNAVFLSARDAAKEFDVNKDTAGKWLRELEHYGFLVMVQGCHLGALGNGKAALYRLTDCPYAGKPSTYDFQNWDGVLFDPKKQNPVRKTRTPCPKNPDIRAKRQITENVEHRPKNPDIRNGAGRPKNPDITSFTISLSSAAIADGAPPQSAVAVGDGVDERQEWARPLLIEVSGKERDRLLKNLAEIPSEKIPPTSEIPKPADYVRHSARCRRGWADD